jgi:PhnB protein
MLKTTPFLLFDGNCAEAMTFYHKCLGGELSLTRLGDSPMKDMLPLEKHNRIINAHLKNGEIDISATDWMASPEYNPVLGNMFSIFVTGKNYDEIKVVFDSYQREQTKQTEYGFKNCMNCRLAYTGNFTINMASRGYLSWRKNKRGSPRFFVPILSAEECKGHSFVFSSNLLSGFPVEDQA